MKFKNYILLIILITVTFKSYSNKIEGNWYAFNERGVLNIEINKNQCKVSLLDSEFNVVKSYDYKDIKISQNGDTYYYQYGENNYFNILKLRINKTGQLEQFLINEYNQYEFFSSEKTDSLINADLINTTIISRFYTKKEFDKLNKLKSWQEINKRDLILYIMKYDNNKLTFFTEICLNMEPKNYEMYFDRHSVYGMYFKIYNGTETLIELGYKPPIGFEETKLFKKKFYEYNDVEILLRKLEKGL